MTRSGSPITRFSLLALFRRTHSDQFLPGRTCIRDCYVPSLICLRTMRLVLGTRLTTQSTVSVSSAIQRISMTLRQRICRSPASSHSVSVNPLLPPVYWKGRAVIPTIVNDWSCCATGVTASRLLPDTFTTVPTSRSPSDSLSPIAISGASQV